MVAVLPMLLYPLMGIGTAQMTALFTEQPRTVVILGAADLPSPSLLDGHRFATKWFRSPADVEKLIVLSDLVEPKDQVPANSSPRTAAEEQLVQRARQLRDLVLERQGLEAEIVPSNESDSAAEDANRETSLASFSGQLTKQFELSGIQILVIIPPDFGRDVARRHAELVERRPSSEIAEEIARPLIVQNSADEKSAIAYRRVIEVIRAWEQSILKEQLRQSQLPETLTSPINAADLDLAERENVSANVWSKVFPALLVIMSLTGAFYPAVDLCAGEKERGTMETLLICPATRSEIVLGKFFTVLLFSMTTALLNLLSVGITGKYMASLTLGQASSRLGDLTMPPLVSLVWVIVVLVPLSTLFSALCLALATFARSSKEGQYYLSPLLIVTLGLTMFCLSPGTEMQPFYSVLPVIGPGLLLKGLLKANGPDAAMYSYLIPVLMTSIGYSLLALWWAVEQFGSEDVLFCEAEQVDMRLWIKHLFRDKGPFPTFAEAVFCFLLMILLQFASWKPFQAAIQHTPKPEQELLQIRLLIIQQILLMAAPALLMGIFLTTSLRQTFSLRWPGLSRLLFAILLPFALQPLAFELLVRLQWFFPPSPQGVAELMQQLKTTNLWLVILAFAVTPAICEEIAFRGFLLSGFRQSGRVTLAVLLSAFTFGIIHMIPQQVFNAMLLGIVLGAMCLRTGSLFPGVAYHFFHNSLSVLHDRFGSSVPTDHAWGLFFRQEDQTLRYQPGLLGLLFMVAIGLLYGLLRPMTNSHGEEPLDQAFGPSGRPKLNEEQTPESESPQESNTKCPSCMRHFNCDIAKGCTGCWCMSLPAALPVNVDAKCLCRECLEKAIAAGTAGLCVSEDGFRIG